MTSPDHVQAAPPQGPLRFLVAFVKGLDGISYWCVAAVMALMAMLVSIQVFVRYAMGSSIDSADELSRLFFIWAIFLAIPHGIRLGVHVGIDLIVKLMSPRVQDILFRTSAALSAILMVVTFWVSWIATMDKWPELMPTLPFTAAVFYIPVLISTGHSFLHLVILIWGGPDVWEQGAQS